MPILLTLIRQKGTSHGRPLRLGFLPLGWIHLGLIWIDKRCWRFCLHLDQLNLSGAQVWCWFLKQATNQLQYQGMPSAFWGAHLKVRGFCSVRFRPVRFAQPSCLSWRGGLREWIWHPVVESLPICRTNENQWKSYVSSPNSGFSLNQYNLVDRESQLLFSHSCP